MSRYPTIQIKSNYHILHTCKQTDFQHVGSEVSLKRISVSAMHSFRKNPFVPIRHWAYCALRSWKMIVLSGTHTKRSTTNLRSHVFINIVNWHLLSTMAHHHILPAQFGTVGPWIFQKMDGKVRTGSSQNFLYLNYCFRAIWIRVTWNHFTVPNVYPLHLQSSLYACRFEATDIVWRN